MIIWLLVDFNLKIIFPQKYVLRPYVILGEKSDGNLILVPLKLHFFFGNLKVLLLILKFGHVIVMFPDGRLWLCWTLLCKRLSADLSSLVRIATGKLFSGVNGLVED